MLGKTINATIRVGIVAGALVVPYAAQAQGDAYGGGRTLRCSSNGGRTFCDADTRNGVRMLRQLSGSRCQEGSTWGYTDRGIWVDRGCRAEFDLSANNAPAYQDRTYQDRTNPDRRYDDRTNPDRAYQDRDRFTRLEPGTTIAVRTNEYIDVQRGDGRVYTGTVDQDVVGGNGRLAIPRGAEVELMVRRASDNDLILDLESVVVNGQRYALRANADRIESRDGVGKNRRTGEFVGGGALLGTIIGAIAGGGKGAAIGAAAGAAAGVGGQVLTRGRQVRVPAESVLTFRLQQPLDMGVADNGILRNGRHYHDYREYRNQ